MRTRDFSAIPVPQGRTGAIFIGMNEYRRPWHLAEQVLVWMPLLRRLKQTPGYLWHLNYFRFPMRIGLVVAFESREAMMEFAKTDEHHAIMHWLVGTDENSGAKPASATSAPVRAGFIRTLVTDEVGYASGNWRADKDEISMVQRWETQREGDSRPHQLPARLRQGIQGVGKVAGFAKSTAALGVQSARGLLQRK